MKSTLLALIMGLSAIAISPTAIKADDHPQRYYDRDARDTHEWNAQENESWHRWLREQHRRDHEWKKASKREQSDYWRWRHDHHD